MKQKPLHTPSLHINNHTHPALEALAHAISDPLKDIFNTENNILFLRAEAHTFITQHPQNTWHLCQSFKPTYDQLEQAHLGATLTSTPPAEGRFNIVVILATRNREENKALIAQATEKLNKNGTLIIAQHNNFGAKLLEKDLKALAPHTHVYSKKHSRVLWCAHQGFNQETRIAYKACQKAQLVPGTSLLAKPGLFSHKGADAGSQELAQIFTQIRTHAFTQFKDKSLKGHGADFGAGWGYLSNALLKNEAIETLDLFEAEKEALTLAEQNLTPHKNAIAINYYWSNVLSAPLKPRYNFIISNPPQHGLHMNDRSLPELFIKKAAQALRPRGALWLVVNSHFKVEPHLEELYKHITLIPTESKSYKVYKAVK